MGQYDDRPYEVGKGKPPVKYRWKKGQSGNPRGPKRRVKRDNATMTELLAEMMNEKAEVTINGKTYLLTKKQIILLQLVHDAGSGTAAQRLKTFKQLNDLGAFNLTAADAPETPEISEARIKAVVEELAQEAERLGLYDK